MITFFTDKQTMYLEKNRHNYAQLQVELNDLAITKCVLLCYS